MNTSKKVSIGIPVYNEINFINNTLHCVVQQGAEQIIISDNASTDGTSEICQEYAAKYPNITYHRFDSLQSVADNFNNCLQLARHDYFMVMGGHDLLSKNYVSTLRKTLDSTDSVAAYTNAVHLSHEYAFKTFYAYTYADLLESDDVKVRLLATIEKLCNCTLYYGLYKKEVFAKAHEECNQYKYNSIDHGVLSHIATQGKLTLCPEATFFRIDPARQEKSVFTQWKRVQKAYHGVEYDAKKHIPELIPLGIAHAQFLMAQDIVSTTQDEKEYLVKVLKILFRRWIVNDITLALLLKEFKEKAKKMGISMTFQK